jgi:hypothetical protein
MGEKRTAGNAIIAEHKTNITLRRDYKMSKIKKISVKSYKAIDKLEIDFKGCSAIVTGGNNQGKTSFLRGLQDRIASSIKPEFIVKKGEEKGYAGIELTTGEKFIWSFDDKGKEKFVFVTADNIKAEWSFKLVDKYFKPIFDVDKFLNSNPKDRVLALQKLFGIDFTEINKEYKEAYDARTAINSVVKSESARVGEVDEMLPSSIIEIESLQKDILSAKDNNTKKDNVKHEVNAVSVEIQSLENEIYLLQEKLRIKRESRVAFENYFNELNYIDIEEKQNQFNASLALNEKIRANNTAKAHREILKKHEESAKQADELVKSIEARKKEMLANVNLPEGISLDEDKILVDGFPLDNAQISTSKKYITALKLGSKALGEVKTMPFDASPLDRKSLDKILAFAESEGLQLLIEKPDFEGGEIEFHLINDDKVEDAL